jgi:hypothetical protein
MNNLYNTFWIGCLICLIPDVVWACSGPGSENAITNADIFVPVATLTLLAVTCALFFRASRKKISWFWGCTSFAVMLITASLALTLGTKSGDCGESSNILLAGGLAMCLLLYAVSWYRSRTI